MRKLRLLFVFLTLTAAFAARVFAWDEAAQQTYNEMAKARLLRAHGQMEKAVEVSIYVLGDEKTEDRIRAFAIKPYSSVQVPIKDERLLRGDALSQLLVAWKDLTTQDYYMDAMCHEPVYGLRFRDAAGAVCFETSLCWGCSNYFIEERDGYDFAALPKKYLPQSALKKQLDQLFETK